MHWISPRKLFDQHKNYTVLVFCSHGNPELVIFIVKPFRGASPTSCPSMTRLPLSSILAWINREVGPLFSRSWTFLDLGTVLSSSISISPFSSMITHWPSSLSDLHISSAHLMISPSLRLVIPLSATTKSKSKIDSDIRWNHCCAPQGRSARSLLQYRAVFFSGSEPFQHFQHGNGVFINGKSHLKCLFIEGLKFFNEAARFSIHRLISPVNAVYLITFCSDSLRYFVNFEDRIAFFLIHSGFYLGGLS